MHILVISGFLGAGKTTFISKIVQKIKRNTVILENEYGQVGIDGDILKAEKKNIWELTEGCICCSMKANFATSVLTIANSLNPEILLVEPTGVGLLSAVMQNIAKVRYEHITLLEPVTIVDPGCVEKYVKEYGDIFLDQIQNARKIVISKTGLFDEKTVLSAEKIIRSYNSDAMIIKSGYDEIPDFVWKGFLEDEWQSLQNRQSKAPQIEMEHIGFEGIRFDSLERFEGYMSAVMRGRFGELIRAKGFMPINGVWSRFDIVNDKYTLVQIAPMEYAKLILIGKSLHKEELSILFEPLCDISLKQKR